MTPEQEADLDAMWARVTSVWDKELPERMERIRHAIRRKNCMKEIENRLHSLNLYIYGCYKLDEAEGEAIMRKAIAKAILDNTRLEIDDLD